MYHKVISEWTFSSFELSCFELRGGQTVPVLCAVIYRPPKHNKDFITDFYELVAFILTRYDRILIIGDFNVHVCCPSKPMAKDFLDLIEAFNLTQHVTGLTQVHGHSLDLVLSYGFSVDNVSVEEAVFSDHCLVIFEMSLSINTRLPGVRHGSVIKSCTASDFNTRFTTMAHSLVNSSTSMNTEEFMMSFIATCSEVLDSVSPLKVMRSKSKQEPDC